MKSRGAKKGKRSPVKKVAKVAPPMRRAIQQIVQGEAETKRATFYQSANDGTGTNIATGLYANRGWAVQNNTITNNTVDILQLIPYIAQGTDDWERIGDRLRPVKLGGKGSVRVAQALRATVATNTTNLHVCMYVLQHVSLKDYTNLRAQNNFGQLLETGEGTTVFFNGVRSSTGTVSDTYSYTTSAAIGYTGGAVPRNWIGYISNARLVVGSNVYDPTLTTITVPTTPLTAI